MQYQHLHEENRRSWNAVLDAHNSHKYDQAAFFRNGGSTLFPEEINLLGDITGRTLVHLQCNAGQDSLSLAARGALVTGVDISDTAIDFARQLSTGSGIPATFHRADVYDWLTATAAGNERFDIAFSSYGAIIWLSDIGAWARGIAQIVKPGGRFVLVEFHPFASMFDWDWQLDSSYSYFGAGRPNSFEHGIGDYVAMSGSALAPSGYLEGVQDFVNPHPGHEFQWPVSDVLQALIDAGLQLRSFREYPYANGGKLWRDMRELPGGRMLPPENLPKSAPHVQRCGRETGLKPSHFGNLWADRARPLAASSIRSFGAALVSSAPSNLRDAAAISSTAARNAASLAFEGVLKPLTLRTYCNEAARISSSLTGGSKLKSVLMFRHIRLTFMSVR